MKVTKRITLDKRAKSLGADKYACKIDGLPKPVYFYIPQGWSRVNNAPFKELTLTLET